MRLFSKIGLIAMGWTGIIVTFYLYYISIKSILLIFNI